MIKLEEVIARWSAAFSGQADVPGVAPDVLDLLADDIAEERPYRFLSSARSLLAEIRERRKLHDQALADLHDLVRLAVEVRAYGRARIAMTDAFEAWVDGLDTKAANEAAQRLDVARRAHRDALDRIEAIAVKLAGGDVERVTGGGL